MALAQVLAESASRASGLVRWPFCDTRRSLCLQPSAEISLRAMPGRLAQSRKRNDERDWRHTPVLVDLATLTRCLRFQLSATVTRKKVAGIEVAALFELLFWLLNRSSSSFCRSAARPFFSAASKAFMVGP